MKITKILAIALCLSMLMSLVSCFLIPDQEPEIAAPKLTLDGNAIRWNIIDEAKSYCIYVNGEKKAEISTYRYSLATLANGEYTIEVTAKSGDKESPKSNPINYVVDRSGASAGNSTTAIELLKDASYDYDGIWESVENIVLTRQIKDRQLWADFVNQFRSNVDEPPRELISNTNGGGWRGEFWGKVMMGATRFYLQTGDEELYEILEETVYDILTTQDSEGRIGTYGKLS